ncbi:hypothetical protein [Fredinandcohnia quinoae]|uniref:Uncharacterized protein n=1 Tax=Fredinandcohnia quinoae TaxID=2918902 RepID=A0AAW5ECZ6_9BACI|nr:hypothetical protein [Fredinandcohnia sp. SECRCQ15]MCH1627936.1 hypothetical protein [Fredinandcohnia sp. SECRCQ15]
MAELLNQFIQTVEEAQQAIIESQANDDPQRFQHAQNLLLHAKEQLQEVKDTCEAKSEFQHAKERLRKLEETQHAIQATNRF